VGSPIHIAADVPVLGASNALLVDPYPFRNKRDKHANGLFGRRAPHIGLGIKMNGTLGPPGAQPAPAPAPKGRRRVLWIFVGIAAPLFWVYVFLKVFVVDVDVYVSQWLFPGSFWLLNFKFVFFLGAVALLLLLLGPGACLLVLSYVVFYPIILVVWKIPAIIFRRKSWTMAFALLNSIISFFQAVRYRVIVTACWLVICLVIIVSDDRLLLWGSCAALVALLITTYVRRLLLLLQPSALLRVYGLIFRSLREQAASTGKLDDDMRALALVDYNKDQLQKWTSKVQMSVLFNRCALFSARRLSDYQRSGVHILSGVLTGLAMVITTTLTFAFIHYALYKADPASFETTPSPSFFTFFYYSFNTFLRAGPGNLHRTLSGVSA
jgi:hypothetical protein